MLVSTGKERKVVFVFVHGSGFSSYGCCYFALLPFSVFIMRLLHCGGGFGFEFGFGIMIIVELTP
jgi:hypothetical protein